MMRKVVALLLGMVLPVLALADAGLAQPALSIQGTIQSVDCQSQTVVLQGPSGSNTLAASTSTAVIVNSAAVPFCTLQQYVGTAATAWLIPSGNEFQVTRINVTGQGSGASVPAPAPAVNSPSTLTLVLGALAVGALGYVIGRSGASQPTYPAYPSDYYSPYGPTYQYGPYGPGYQYGPYGPGYQYGPAYQYGGGQWSPGYRQPYSVQCEMHPEIPGCPNRENKH